MMELLFSSNNSHKVEEIRNKLKSIVQIRSLKDLGYDIDIPETGKTLHDNALIKARFLYQETKMNCFADDTGLMVEALNGEPGVYSARYAGEPKSDANNIQKLLTNLKDNVNRNAYFITVIALICEGKEYLIEGKVEGEILESPIGTNGFGYDPVFKPAGSELSFAEMSQEQKNKLSHRGKAVELLLSRLQEIVNS
jgi:XTP/dITP diphosphohydrolase